MRNFCLSLFSIFGILTFLAVPAVAEENVGQVRQPIVAGALVDNNTQKARGLVTVGGGCSGTLINQYWVLTADHCVTSNGRIGGPSAALGNVRVTAAWSATTVTPTRLVRNWGGSGRDVALVFLGNGDFGTMPIQLLNYSGLDPGMTMVKYGRGISAYASAGPPAVAATNDGRYRTATFSVSSVGTNTYTLQANSAGQVGNGGDSGGPDWVSAGGSLLNIAGVQSTCVATGYVPGQPANWNWATGVSSCNSAPIWDIYYDIVEITRPQYVAFCKDYAAKAVAAVSESNSLGCGFGGARWTADSGAHLDWCIGLTGNQGPPNTETAERTSALRQCRREKGAITLEEARRFPTDVIVKKTPAEDAGVLKTLPEARKFPDSVIVKVPGADDGGSPASLIPAPSPAPGVNFAGDWSTVTGGTAYAMSLQQDAAGRVTGEYAPAGSADRYRIAGSVVGTELVAQWTEGAATGIARFTIAADGNSFSGGWASGATMPAPTQNQWTGARVAVAPPDVPVPPPMAGGRCGPPGGAAVVVIPNPDLDRLNVRDAPGGRVLGTIPEGSEVSIVGQCGSELAAGIVAPAPGEDVANWCQIDRPMTGCVFADFLDFGAAGGGGAAGIVAGIAKPQSQPPPPPADMGAGGAPAVLIKGANVRSEPDSKKQNVIATLGTGSMVAVIECGKSWCRVQAPGIGSGWISKQFLQIGGGAPESGPPPDVAMGEPSPAPGPAAPAGGDGCGLPMGMATVVIADPKLDKLNVRDAPGGKVVTTVPEGSQVSVIGECGAVLAAGIAKPAPTPGWCQIDSPVAGCVSAKFLAAGGAAGGGGAAGFAAAPSFAGAWQTTVDGIGHEVVLSQNGGTVSGSYKGDEGSAGQIKGKVKGNVLRFSWVQNDGQTGSGRFALSADGQSFEGSYTFSSNPDQVDGIWTGTR